MPLSRAQVALYWREWSACKAVRKARGLCITDEARHALHREALGQDKSMTAFSNRDLDRVLAIFRTFSRPDDLSSQLRAEEQPNARKEDCLGQAYEVLDELELLGKTFAAPDGKVRYLNGTSWAIFHKPADRLDDVDAAKLLGVLRRQLWREQKKARADDKPAEAQYEAENQPF